MFALVDGSVQFSTKGSAKRTFVSIVPAPQSRTRSSRAESRACNEVPVPASAGIFIWARYRRSSPHSIAAATTTKATTGNAAENSGGQSLMTPR